MPTSTRWFPLTVGRPQWENLIAGPSTVSGVSATADHRFIYTGSAPSQATLTFKAFNFAGNPIANAKVDALSISSAAASFSDILVGDQTNADGIVYGFVQPAFEGTAFVSVTIEGVVSNTVRIVIGSINPYLIEGGDPLNRLPYQKGDTIRR